MLEGGCLCGRIRYVASGAPFHETLCHCSLCRRASGAAGVAWFSVRRDEFRLTAGRPRRFRSSPRGVRSFCPHCGTPLTFESDHLPDEIDITVCSLDDPDAVPPRDHIHVSSKPRWLQLGDCLPEHPQGRRA